MGSDEHDVIDLDPPGAAQVQQPLVQQPEKEEEKQPEKGQPLATSGSAEWLFKDSRLQFMKDKREIDAAFQRTRKEVAARKQQEEQVKVVWLEPSNHQMSGTDMER